MNREYFEELENKLLSPFAVRSAETKGRRFPMERCPLRTEFQRDRDRIIHCKSFRRLKYKPQVFLSPEGDHYRTRLTHTLEVAQIARTISKAIRLNEELTEAIALGHDIGHTPFGHIGERVLDSIPGITFKHNEQSLRVVDYLENGGKGLNLTFEVRDGILNHRTDDHPATLEAKVVNFADKIAYLNHDIDDAIRGGILCEEQLPRECIAVLGNSHGKRINTMIADIVKQSENQPKISMSKEVAEATGELRKYMFLHVYLVDYAKREEEKASYILKMLYGYYMEHPEMISPEYMQGIDMGSPQRGVVDYIAGMSDRFAIAKFEELFVPRPWQK